MRAALLLLALTLMPAARAGAADAPSQAAPTSVPEVAPGGELAVVLEPASITVGDPIEVTATLQLTTGTTSGIGATLIGLDDRWGEATLLAPPQRVESTDPAAQPTWRFRVTAFRPGRFELPALGVRVSTDPPTEIVGSSVVLEVRSVLPADGDTVGPMPPAAPRPRGVGKPFVAAASLLALAIAAAAWALARRREELAAAPAPLLAPREEFGAALQQIAADGHADPVAGHAELSRAMRRYLGRRFDFPALESTSTQVARRLARPLAVRQVDPTLPRTLARLLADCDGVKFARRPTSSAALGERCTIAAGLVDSLETHLAAPMEAGDR